MTLIAFIMTFLVGGFTGVFATAYVLITSQDEVPLEVRLDIHPSTRDTHKSTILDYPVTG